MYNFPVYILQRSVAYILNKPLSRFFVQIAFIYDMWHLYKLQIDCQNKATRYSWSKLCLKLKDYRMFPLADNGCDLLCTHNNYLLRMLNTVTS